MSGTLSVNELQEKKWDGPASRLAPVLLSPACQIFAILSSYTIASFFHPFLMKKRMNDLSLTEGPITSFTNFRSFQLVEARTPPTDAYPLPHSDRLVAYLLAWRSLWAPNSSIHHLFFSRHTPSGNSFSFLFLLQRVQNIKDPIPSWLTSPFFSTISGFTSPSQSASFIVFQSYYLTYNHLFLLSSTALSSATSTLLLSSRLEIYILSWGPSSLHISSPPSNSYYTVAHCDQFAYQTPEHYLSSPFFTMSHKLIVETGSTHSTSSSNSSTSAQDSRSKLHLYLGYEGCSSNFPSLAQQPVPPVTTHWLKCFLVLDAARNGLKPSGRPVVHNNAHPPSNEKRLSGYTGGKWK